ncbi:MAG: hypothetical protein PHU21_03420 [Elusimicrobia bacterium]|nr:hypothetical protein [Elusimicrobiota bacterium]
MQKSPAAKNPSPPLFQRLALAGAGILASLLFIVLAAALVEGFCGAILVLGAPTTKPHWMDPEGSPAPAPEDPIMGQEDPVIGHTLQPNLLVRYANAPGRWVRTNSQGFRNDVDFPAAAPQGRLRVLCSGDSMTFGLGASNGETWPDRLAAIDPRIETVNMGASRYGIDQMYLWYMRAGTPLEHAVHVVALIPLDVLRLGFEKDGFLDRPRLEVREGRLEVVNQPVHNAWYKFRLQPLFTALGDLHMVRLSRGFVRIHASPPQPLSSSTEERLTRILEELAQASRAQGSVLVVALLPSDPRAGLRRQDEFCREFLASQLPALGIPFLDLDSGIADLPVARIRRLFIPEGSPFMGHYTAEGASYVAERLHAKLIADTRIAARLKACQRPRRS